MAGCRGGWIGRASEFLGCRNAPRSELSCRQCSTGAMPLGRSEAAIRRPIPVLLGETRASQPRCASPVGPAG